MKSLNVRHLEFSRDYPDLEIISEKLDKDGPGEMLNTVNWNAFSYRPDVKFNIAYTNCEILLKYYITEEYIKAEMIRSDQAVWEDSCVEFFIQATGDNIYYNLEVNPIGTCLLGAGTNRTDRKRAGSPIIQKIRIQSSLGSRPFKEIKGINTWSVTLAIPFGVFWLHPWKEIKNMEFRANFYKCGDKLSVPHYLTWNPVETSKPDFHQPKFFGLLKFI